jgi:hypothetical protein
VLCLFPTLQATKSMGASSSSLTSSKDRARSSHTAAQLLFELLTQSFPCNVYRLRATDFWSDGELSRVGEDDDDHLWLRTSEQLATTAALNMLFPSRELFLIDGGAKTMTLTILAPNDEATVIADSSLDQPEVGKSTALSVSTVEKSANSEPSDSAGKDAMDTAETTVAPAMGGKPTSMELATTETTQPATMNEATTAAEQAPVANQSRPLEPTAESTPTAASGEPTTLTTSSKSLSFR